MTKRALLIEDDQALHAALSGALKERGFMVQGASDGEEGLRMIKNNPLPDLVILDLILPKKSGLEMLEEIRKDLKTHNLPVAILTNIDDPQMVQRAMELGVVAYLLKVNYEVSDIVDRLVKILERGEVPETA